MTMNIYEVNALTHDAFVERFGDVIELSPWVAEVAARSRPYPTRDDMVRAFATAFRLASRDSQLAAIRAHPDLATKAKLTPESKREQASVGLDSLSFDEFVRFTALNDAYKARFEFPFIYAVKGATKQQILESFESRMKNMPQEELNIAISQVCRICRFRIEDRVST